MSSICGWKCASQRNEQVADRMIALQGVPHGQFGVNYVAVASALSIPGDVAPYRETRDNCLDSSLGNTCLRGDVAGSALRVLGNERKHSAIVAEERPM